jgi:hypothetical protein
MIVTLLNKKPVVEMGTTLHQLNIPHQAFKVKTTTGVKRNRPTRPC